MVAINRNSPVPRTSVMRRKDLIGGCRVKVARRLSASRQARRIGQRTAKGRPLLFTARQRRWPVVRHGGRYRLGQQGSAHGSGHRLRHRHLASCGRR